MKKIAVCVVLAFVIISSVYFTAERKDNEKYLRIHIRANSNLEVDQAVKYEIKDVVVNYLTPYISEIKSKEEVVTLLNEKEKIIENVVDEKLKSEGFSYKSNLTIRNEKFPTRIYEDFTLEEGYYDAVIIELGEAKGDNWWCVVYPPLCFSGQERGIKYKSKIKEVIDDFKKKQGT